LDAIHENVKLVALIVCQMGLTFTPMRFLVSIQGCCHIEVDSKMTATSVMEALLKQLKPHLPKVNPSAFSVAFLNYLSLHKLVNSEQLDKKPNKLSIPATLTNDKYDGGRRTSLFNHLMHRDCFGAGCVVREETLPEWKNKMLIVRTVESRMGGRMGDVKGDIISEAKKGKRRIVKRDVAVSELAALGGRWMVVEEGMDVINKEEMDGKTEQSVEKTREMSASE
jgi:hypothetical protein